MLDQETINIVKSTAPVLKKTGLQITKHFYEIMFKNNPEVKPLFNMDKQESGEQPLALANSIIAVAENIDNLDAIMTVIKKICKTHTDALVKPEHYPIVGKNLLIAIKDTLGDAATDEVIKAWELAYEELAKVFIQLEQEMYSEAK